MAKTGALMCTGGRGDLNLQTRVSFQVAPTTSFVQIAPPTCALATVSGITSGQTTSFTELQFTVTVGQAQIPCWLKPGVGLLIAFSVANTPYSIYGLVSSIDTSAGQYFTVPLSFHDQQFTKLGNPSSVISSATATLITQFQKAIFQAPSTNTGTITLADCIDTNNDIAWNQAIAAGQSWEVDAPWMTKYDLKDWLLKGNGTDVVNISFV